MTIQEILKNSGLTDEQIKTIVDGMKENKIYTSSEENLDIRYGKLKTDHDSLSKQYSEAQALIEEMKKSNKDNESIQSRVAEYESKIEALTKELSDEKLSSAIKVGLLSEKATDIDYLTFKLREAGELKLNENGEIDGFKDKLDDLKKKYPNQFEITTQKQIDPNKLNVGKQDESLTREGILKMTYSQRADLYNSDPEGFNKIMKS